MSVLHPLSPRTPSISPTAFSSLISQIREVLRTDLSFANKFAQIKSYRKEEDMQTALLRSVEGKILDTLKCEAENIGRKRAEEDDLSTLQDSEGSIEAEKTVS